MSGVATIKENLVIVRERTNHWLTVTAKSHDASPAMGNFLIFVLWQMINHKIVKSILDHNTLQATSRDSLMHDQEDLRIARDRFSH